MRLRPRGRPSAILLVLAVSLAACSKTKIAVTGVGSYPTPTARATKGTDPTSSAGGSTGAPSPGSTGKPPTSPGPAASQGSEMAVSVTPGSRCAIAGQPMTVKIQADPRAGLSMVVGYSDSQPHGNYGFGDTDDSGAYTWAFVVGADAPTGEATVLVAAKAWDGSKGGSGKATFTVSKRC